VWFSRSQMLRVVHCSSLFASQLPSKNVNFTRLESNNGADQMTQRRRYSPLSFGPLSATKYSQRTGSS
jgi:hypothetical protein